MPLVFLPLSTVAPHDDLLGIADDVGIRHHVARADDKSGARGTRGPGPLPGRKPVPALSGHFDNDNGLFDFALRALRAGILLCAQSLGKGAR